MTPEQKAIEDAAKALNDAIREGKRFGIRTYIMRELDASTRERNDAIEVICYRGKAEL